KAAPIVIAAPFRKSRRGMARSIPNSRSVNLLRSWSAIFEIRSVPGRAPSHRVQFLNRAPRLVHGLIRVRGCARVGIRYGNSAKTFAAKLAGTLAFGPFRIEQEIVFVRVSMRPAIDGDGANVLRRIKPGTSKNARKLVADISLKCFKWRGQQITASCAVLVALRQTWKTRSALHSNENGLIGIFRRLVATDVHAKIEIHLMVVHARARHILHTELLERLPVSDRYRGIHQRYFHTITQSFFLFFRKLRTEIRNHHVPARHDDLLSVHGT